VIGPVIGAAMFTLVPQIMNLDPNVKILAFSSMIILIIDACTGRAAPKSALRLRDRLAEERCRTILGETPSVSARDIVKRYGGVTALNGVSLDVREGEIFGIIGPNGAGKSTLFDILCGITVPSSGSVRIMGREIGRYPISYHCALRRRSHPSKNSGVFPKARSWKIFFTAVTQAFGTA